MRRYEWPIVAERANIIQTARTVVISPPPARAERHKASTSTSKPYLSASASPKLPWNGAPGSRNLASGPCLSM